MAELTPDAIGGPSPFSRGWGRWLERVTTWWALGGGLVFCALVLMSIVSIVGRKLFSAPIQGDMELMQMGSAIGAAAFLPLCEVHDHHIKVDAFTNRLSRRARGRLEVLGHGLLALTGALLTWRTTLYAISAQETMEVSALLLVPLWWPVGLLVPSFALLTLAALARTWLSLRTALGRSLA